MREVYAHYGLAMYAAQCVEVSLVLLVISSKFSERPAFTRADHDDLWNSLWQRAMRARIKQALKAVELSDEVAVELDAVCTRRNHLAHNFCFDHGPSFVTATGRATMIAELIADRDMFFALDERLTAAYQRIRRKHGLSDEAIADAMTSLLAGNEEWPPPTGSVT